MEFGFNDLKRSRTSAFMSARQIARVLGAAVVTTGAVLLGAPIPSASAQPCPDVELVFARGTSEPPGVGGVGQAYVDALRSQVGASRSRCIRLTTMPAAIFRRPHGIRHVGRRRDQGRGDSCPDHRGELPQHPNRARRIFSRSGRGRFRHLGCHTGGSSR